MMMMLDDTTGPAALPSTSYTTNPVRRLMRVQASTGLVRPGGKPFGVALQPHAQGVGCRANRRQAPVFLVSSECRFIGLAGGWGSVQFSWVGSWAKEDGNQFKIPRGAATHTHGTSTQAIVIYLYMILY